VEQIATDSLDNEAVRKLSEQPTTQNFSFKNQDFPIPLSNIKNNISPRRTDILPVIARLGLSGRGNLY